MLGRSGPDGAGRVADRKQEFSGLHGLVPASPRPRVSASAGLTGILILVFLAGVIMASPGIALKLAGDMPFLLIALLCIPLLTSGLTVGLLVFTVLAWKKRYWSLMGRLHYSLIALFALLFNPILLFVVAQIMGGRL